MWQGKCTPQAQSRPSGQSSTATQQHGHPCAWRTDTSNTLRIAGTLASCLPAITDTAITCCLPQYSVRVPRDWNTFLFDCNVQEASMPSCVLFWQILNTTMAVALWPLLHTPEDFKDQQPCSKRTCATSAGKESIAAAAAGSLAKLCIEMAWWHAPGAALTGGSACAHVRYVRCACLAHSRPTGARWAAGCPAGTSG